MYYPIVCFSHKFCTNCPVRKGCPIRPTFYSKEQFERVLRPNGPISLSQLHFVTYSEPVFYQFWEPKRQAELKEHPTYSRE